MAFQREDGAYLLRELEREIRQPAEIDRQVLPQSDQMAVMNRKKVI